MEKVFKGKLVAVNHSIYTNYVFYNEEENEYLLCTKVPNWNTPEIELNTSGYVSYEEATPGDTYVTPTGEIGIYRYSKLYFKNFIKINNTSDIIVI